MRFPYSFIILCVHVIPNVSAGLIFREASIRMDIWASLQGVCIREGLYSVGLIFATSQYSFWFSDKFSSSTRPFVEAVLILSNFGK